MILVRALGALNMTDNRRGEKTRNVHSPNESIICKKLGSRFYSKDKEGNNQYAPYAKPALPFIKLGKLNTRVNRPALMANNIPSDHKATTKNR